jgi:hypothetical protein
MNCITCSRPLPKDTEEHPHYFAQHKLKTEPDDYSDFAEELKQILQYLEAVLDAVPEARTISEDVELQLIWLARNLCREAQHRLELVVDAAELWERRAEARKEG